MFSDVDYFLNYYFFKIVLFLVLLEVELLGSTCGLFSYRYFHTKKKRKFM